MKTSVNRPIKAAFQSQTSPSRSWGFVLLFLLLVGLAWFTNPLSSKAQTIPGGTVPPSAPPPTILVGPVDEVGTIQSSAVVSASPGTLIVAGVFISTTAETRIDERVGPLQAGAWVRVEGDNNSDMADTLVARRIKVVPPMPYIKVVGPLDELTTSSVVIDGISLNRTTSTLVIGDPVAGQDRVGARAAIESTGDLLALQVVKQGTTDDGGDDEEEPNKTKLISVIQSLPAQGTVGDWVVGGISVKVTAQTQILQRKGPLAPGAWVKIIGQVDANGVLVAERVQTTHTRLFHRLVGVLDELNAAEVVVDGINLERSDASTVVGDPQVGKAVVVRALPGTDGTLVAVVIESRGRNGGNNKPGLVVKFVGRVDALPADGLYGDWTIAGRTVNVPVGAYIDEHKGTARVGAQVKVTALLAVNGALTAVEIAVESPGNGGGNGKECEYTEFTGVVESLPAGQNLLGTWLVSGKTVHVTQGTQIKSGDRGGRGGGDNVQTEQPISVAVGSEVKVYGFVLDDGSIRAKKISVLNKQEQEVVHVGVIKQLPANGLLGTWLVGERTVQVTNQTALQSSDGAFADPTKEPVRFAVGKLVRVNGLAQNDGTILAQKVKLLQ